MMRIRYRNPNAARDIIARYRGSQRIQSSIFFCSRDGSLAVIVVSSDFLVYYQSEQPAQNPFAEIDCVLSVWQRISAKVDSRAE